MTTHKSLTKAELIEQFSETLTGGAFDSRLLDGQDARLRRVFKRMIEADPDTQTYTVTQLDGQDREIEIVRD